MRRAYCIKRVDRVRNELVKNLCGVKKCLDEGVLKGYDHLVRLDEAMVIKSMTMCNYWAIDCEGN